MSNPQQNKILNDIQNEIMQFKIDINLLQNKLKQSKIRNEIKQFKTEINLLQDKLKQSKKYKVYCKSQKDMIHCKSKK